MTARRPLATPDEAAAYLGLAVKTLYNWRARRTGPRSLKVGGRVRYPWADLEKWVDLQAQVAS